MRYMLKAVSIVIIATIMIGIASPVVTYSADENIIEISTAEEMWQLAEDINNGQTFSKKTIVLKNDIDLGCSEQRLWTPMQNFNGIFDGQNFSIRNMKIGNNSSDLQKIGLFGTVSGKIKRVNIIDSSINISDYTGSYMGILVGCLDIVSGKDGDNIEFCKIINSEINIETNKNVTIGGMIGYIKNSNVEDQGIISNCSCSVKIDIKNENEDRISDRIGNIGGIIGSSSKSKIINCINNSDIAINVPNNIFYGSIGGIIGDSSYKTIINCCYNKGNINVIPKKTIKNGVQYGSSVYEGLRELSQIGGITGYLNSVEEKTSIDSCFNEGDINSPGQVGGIAGGIVKGNTYWNNGTIDYGDAYIKNCYNLGEIKANYPYSYAGGICGANGDLDGVTRYSDGSGGNINNCYNVGNISCSNKKGGIVGLNNIGGEITSTYYLSGIQGFGKNNGNSCSTIEKTSEEMKGQEFVNLLNKDEDIFLFNKYLINKGYPLIKNIQISGMYQMDGYWFLLDNNMPKFGWQYVNENWYYFAKLNEIKKNSDEYYPEGTMITGWNYLKAQDDNFYWFYFAKSDKDIIMEGTDTLFYPIGALATGWQNIKIDGKEYRFYLSRKDNDIEKYVHGAMIKGRQRVDGKYYYFAQSSAEFEGYVEGSMVQNTSIGGYIYDSLGVCQTNDITPPTIIANDIIYGENLNIRLQDESDVVAWQINQYGQQNESEWIDFMPTKDISFIKEGLNAGTYYIYSKDIEGNVSSRMIIVSIPLEAEIGYSNTELTNQNVIVTITANEKIQEAEGWTLSEDEKKITKEYSENTTETITIKDLAGNEISKTIQITNIDKVLPTTNVTYSTTSITNQNVMATIVANEEIQGITGWTLSNNKKTLTKIYQNNVEETIQVKDLAGNTIDKNISIKNIDKTKPEIAGVENANNYNDSVTITATDANPGTLLLEKDGEKVEGYTNGKEIIQEGTYKLTAVDKLGNTTIVNFTIKYVRGDLNKDSKIDMLDVLKILKHLSQEKKNNVSNKHPEWKLNEKGKIISDTDRNGKVEILDVLKILKYISAKSNRKTALKHPEWLNLN